MIIPVHEAEIQREKRFINRTATLIIDTRNLMEADIREYDSQIRSNSEERTHNSLLTLYREEISIRQ